jgi:hypothetical protein
MYTSVLKTSAAATRSKAIEARRLISRGRAGRNPGIEAMGLAKPHGSSDQPRGSRARLPALRHPVPDRRAEVSKKHP